MRRFSQWHACCVQQLVTIVFPGHYNPVALKLHVKNDALDGYIWCMKKNKKKKSQKADIEINENIIVSEHVSYNSLVIEDIDFISRTLVLDADKFDKLTDSIKNKLDSLSEMGEMESLRLQMAMERLSKFMLTLANILKKMSETDSDIIENIK